MENICLRTLSIPRSDHFHRAYFCATRRLLCLLAFNCFATGTFLKIRNSTWTFPNFSWRIFSHVTNLEQSRARKIIWRIIIIPNRTFLLRFGGISGEFGRSMARILVRRSRAKIPMARPNEPDMLPKCTKKIRLGIYRTQIQPKI